MKSEKGAKQMFVQTCPPASQNEDGLHCCQNTLKNSYKVKYVRRANRTSIGNIPLWGDTIGSQTLVCIKITWTLAPRGISDSLYLGWNPDIYVSNSQMLLLQVVEDSTLRTIGVQVTGVRAGRHFPWQYSWINHYAQNMKQLSTVPCMGEGNVLNDSSLENPCLRKEDIFSLSHWLNQLWYSLGRDTGIGTEGVPAISGQARTWWVKIAAPECPPTLLFSHRIVGGHYKPFVFDSELKEIQKIVNMMKA